MHITLHAVGRNMPDWVEQACLDYSKRLPSQYRFDIREYAQAKNTRDKRRARAGKTSTEELETVSSVAVELEGGALLAGLTAKNFVVVLDTHGKTLSTHQLADQLQQWQLDGRDIALVVGGPEGLSPAVKARADFTLSLSALTLPHPMVRVILLEQLYRAHSILVRHPYHRE